jgi:asparagine synthase (glutamine-hydrolysing)
MRIILDNRYSWISTNVGIYTVHYIGSFDNLLPIIEAIVLLGEKPNSEYVSSIVNKLVSPGAVIMQSKQTIIAFTDHFRCYPIFYTMVDSGIICNSARKLKDLIGFDYGEWDTLAAEEFAMSGYVTGSGTLFKNIKQLQSGECLISDSENNSINIVRYYRYTPIQEQGRSDSDWIDELESVMSGVIDRMVERANGRRIKLPLSAGLDSRLLACGLHEYGYDNLETFSYGLPGNWEARGAKEVAKRLNLPWKLITTSRHEARQVFWSKQRKDFFSFSDGLSSLPNLQEFYPMSKMHQSGGSTEDTIIINGQTGDFISGGHITSELLQPGADVRTLLDRILNKHYALWRSLMTKDRTERIEAKVLGLLGVDINTKLTIDELVSLYERWECEERQCKWVINGQRMYDFFGYDWQLPLWDVELVRFFQKVPNHLKFNQRLYRLWLERWDYKNLFREFNPVVWRWPGAAISVVPLAKSVDIVLGKHAKQRCYEVFGYWNHYSEHFAPYTYKEYFKVSNDIRNNISLNVRTWANENNLSSEIVNIGQDIK